MSKNINMDIDLSIAAQLINIFEIISVVLLIFLGFRLIFLKNENCSIKSSMKYVNMMVPFLIVIYISLTAIWVYLVIESTFLNV